MSVVPSALRGGPKDGLAAVLSTPTAPAEVYVLDAAGQPRQLSHQNDAGTTTCLRRSVA